MNKTIAYCVLICSAAVVVVLSAVAPRVLNDENDFLKEFIGGQLLSFLGVIVTITLASAAQLHIALNNIEEKASKKNAFAATRAEIRSGAMWLIGLLLLAVFLVVLKELIVNPCGISLLNGAALIIVIWNVLILISMTDAIFALRPQDRG